MRFELYTDYAIRTLRLLHVRKDEVLTTMEIAQSIGITSPVFVHYAPRLRHAGLLKTIRGHKGGFVLGKPANEISIYDVYLCMEGELRINDCLENGEPCEHGKQVKCKLHSILYGKQEKWIEEMSNIFIADLV